MSTSTVGSVVRIEKPWGYEIHWAHTDRYVGKILHVKAGESLSLQYHDRKDETIYVQSGRVRFELGTEETRSTRELGPGDAVHIHPGLVHRMTALETSDILEASTPEIDDVVRLDDRYGRTGA